MEDYCEGCIHYVLQAVACPIDREGRVLWEPTCIAEKCIKGGKD